MKMRIILFVLLSSVMVSTFAQKKAKKGKTAPQQEQLIKSELDSVSYGLGVLIGGNLKNAFDTINYELFTKALKDAYKKTEIIDATAANQLVNGYVMKQQKKKGEASRKIGDDFLAKNKTLQGVITTASGLQYKVIKEGTGIQPAAIDKVKVHYEGKLIDGTIFDSSIQRGEPISFPLNQVIPGWTEGLQLMKEGAKYQFVIPAELAYGDNPPPGGQIQPGSVLIFDVELLQVEKETEQFTPQIDIK